MTTATSTIQLISIIDLRPIDWQSGKRLAIPAEQCNVCDRCGRLHAKVYEVLADSKTYNVGSGCCRQMFGWEPTKEEVFCAEKVAKDRAIQAALLVVAQPIIDQVNKTIVPELRYHSSRWTVCGYDIIWTVPGNDHLGIRVQSGEGTLPQQSAIVLSASDLKRWERIWKCRQVKEIVGTLQDYDKKKANKLVFAICDLMGINEEK